MGRLAQTLGGNNAQLLTTASVKSKAIRLVEKFDLKFWFSQANFAVERKLQLNVEIQVHFHLGTVIRYIQAGKC